MLVNINESKNNLQAINEVYFGKTKEILAIEKQLDLVRNKYMNRYLTNIFVNNDPDLLKLNRMIEDYFGFGCFSLNIINEPIVNGFTMPIDNRIGLKNQISKKYLIVDKGTFKFNKSADYTCMVYIYSGVMFNPAFTTGEVMSVILHEIGHNFYSALNNEYNGIMTNVYTYSCFILRLLIGIKNPSLAIKNILYSSDLIVKTKENIKKYLRENDSITQKIIDTIVWAKNIVEQVKGLKFKLLDLGSLGILPMIYATINTTMYLSPIELLITGFPLKRGYAFERTADNFATMYGYGPDNISFFNKASSKNINQASLIENIYMKIPIISNIYAINTNLTYMIMSCFDEHPVGISRCSDQLNMLKRELEKSDIDPKMKKTIQEDIKLCEKNIKDITNISGGLKNKDILRNAYYKALYEISDSKEFKDIILDDASRFDAYDDTYNNKLKGGK